MHVLLTGLSGSGKSSVAARVGEILARPVVDLDARIEAEEGKTIAAIFQERGEAAFRALELAALGDLVTEPDSVVALGGGAICNEEGYAAAQRLGTLVWLSVPASVAADRLAKDSARPLLADAAGRRRTLETMLRLRVEHYARAEIVVDATATVDVVAREIAAAVSAPVFVHVVRSHTNSYPVRIHAGSPQALAREIAAVAGASRIVLVCDRHVLPRVEDVCAGLTKASVIAVDAGEPLKQLSGVEALALALEAKGCDRDTVLVAIGGGSLGDAVGFVASVYRRGVRWVSVPTTLLSMVDSSLGGKTGVNLGHAKNLLGAFYPPIAVLTQTSWLGTLDAREVRSGLAEMLKVAATHDANYFERLTKLDTQRFDAAAPVVIEAIARAVGIKAKVVSEDEFERGERKVLNFGHTFGHAFESAAELRDLRHGEAVALGMVAETEYAASLGRADSEVLAALTFAMQTLGFSQNWRPLAMRAKQYVASDKKRHENQVRMPVVPRLGRFEWLDADVRELEAFLDVEGARV
ncbi:MAG: 3-dehydroquinate synthase [Deltaproteobacteria bacterium]|nr:3-dehydroquinate synthase [Deltaproteobacteria bacterium]